MEWLCAEKKKGGTRGRKYESVGLRKKEEVEEQDQVMVVMVVVVVVVKMKEK